jgi:putative endonuclease
MRSALQATGAQAEEAAARYLAARGLAIVSRNFRTRLGEIDLVARDGETLVFIEVRLRASDGFGGAAESIDGAKRRRIVAAAHAYLAQLRAEPPCRFDVVTLDGRKTRWLRAAFDLGG